MYARCSGSHTSTVTHIFAQLRVKSFYTHWNVSDQHFLQCDKYCFWLKTIATPIPHSIQRSACSRVMCLCICICANVWVCDVNLTILNEKRKKKRSNIRFQIGSVAKKLTPTKREPINLRWYYHIVQLLRCKNLMWWWRRQLIKWIWRHQCLCRLIIKPFIELTLQYFQQNQ